jgi:uncharacterized protein YggU (UPF0235/DUF167 family)
MTLAEKINQLAPSVAGLPCGVSKVLSKLDEEDKKALEIVMLTPPTKGQISNRQIHQLLIAEGYDVAFSSIRLHRGKQCRCYTGKEGVLRVKVEK